MRRTTKNVVVEGHVADGYESVASQFKEHLASGEERGAAFCLTRDGEVMVDIWGGYRDVARKVPWEQDTAALVYSVTKGLAALAMLQLHQAGAFEYDAPVAEYWPEFAQGGKGDVTVRTLMNHQAGLAAIDHVFSMEHAIRPDKAEMRAEILARQTPMWQPGSDQGYHATTYGMYVGELFRRLGPQPFSDYFQEKIAGPLDADVWIGLPDEVASRVAEIEAPSALQRFKNMLPHIIKGETPEAHIGRSFLSPKSLTKRALLNPKLVGGGPELYNLPHVRCYPILWGGAIATARGLARIFGALANEGSFGGEAVIDGGLLEPVFARQGWSQHDKVLGKPLGWSQGFLKEEGGVFSPTPESFGHAGLGGALGWADPINHISIGYVTNTLDWRVRSPRCIRLCRAVYDVVGR